MYSSNRLVTVCLCAVLFMGLLISTAAASCMPEELTYETSPGCFFSESEGNVYDGSKPIIIFFPGGGHCNTIRGTVEFIKEKELYDDFDVDVVAVAINNFNNKADPKDWDKLAQGTLEWVKEKIENLPNDERPVIIVDCMSLGGQGATLFTKYALEEGILVSEINYGDACTELEATKDQLKEFMDNGVEVNVYTCWGPSKISARCRDYVEELKGEKNFYGIILDCKHNMCLHDAIFVDGLHEDL